MVRQSLADVRFDPTSGHGSTRRACPLSAIAGSRRRYSITCRRGRAADVDCLCCNLVNPHYERIGRFLASYDAINYLRVLHHQLTRCTATFASMQTSLASWLCVINKRTRKCCGEITAVKNRRGPSRNALTPSSNNRSSNNNTRE